MFAASDTFQLTIDPVQDADSLNDEFSLRLRSTESIDTGARYRGTVIDDDPLATATFSRTDIKIFEGSEAQLSVRVAAPEGESFPTQAGDQNIVLSVTPAAAVGVDRMSDRPRIPLSPCASGPRRRRCHFGTRAG